MDNSEDFDLESTSASTEEVAASHKFYQHFTLQRLKLCITSWRMYPLLIQAALLDILKFPEFELLESAEDTFFNCLCVVSTIAAQTTGRTSWETATSYVESHVDSKSKSLLFIHSIMLGDIM